MNHFVHVLGPESEGGQTRIELSANKDSLAMQGVHTRRAKIAKDFVLIKVYYAIKLK